MSMAAMAQGFEGTGESAIAYRLRLTEQAYKAVHDAPRMSQRAFAAAVGIEPNVWNDYVQGRYVPSPQSALAIKRATGVSLDWIFDGDLRHVSAEMAAAINRLAAEDRDREAS